MSEGWFGAEPEEKPKRDRYKRPLLFPRLATQAPWPERVPYTRASTMGDYVEDHTGLYKWETAYIVKGMGEREDLAAMASALPRLTGDSNFDRPVAQELRRIGELAAEHAGRDQKANYGTAIHGFTDPGAADRPVPARMQADVESYFDVMAGIEQTESELFVANDAYMAAGTLDGLYIIPGYDQEILGDKKTGTLHPLGFAVQMAVYAGGDIYDVETDKRGDSLLERVNQERALLIHIPRQGARTDLYWIDLMAARYYADVACNVRAGRSDKSIMTRATEVELRGI